MPGVDFDRLRAEITMAQVLHLLAFEPVSCSGPQWYGCCPLHESPSKRRRSFSVNMALGRYYCHRCHSHGNQLELWAAATKLPLVFNRRTFCPHIDLSWQRGHPGRDGRVKEITVVRKIR